MVAASVAALPAVAAPRVPSIDLRDPSHVAIAGAVDVSAAGDVNGDGVPDVLVSRGDVVKKPSRGRSWVVFGSAEMRGTIRLEELGDGGFAIEGADADDHASRIAPAGDVNADGLADVIVGAPGAETTGPSSGAAYVVFGKTDSSPVLLAEFDTGTQGERGFRIAGAGAGIDVAPMGDVDGDGYDDVIVATPGPTYVVHGKEDSLPVDLTAIGNAGPAAGGYRIDVPANSNGDRRSVAGVGDVNEDGTPDLAIGTVLRARAPGSVRVVFGRADGERVDATEPGDWGWRTEGPFGGSATGWDVAPAGDVNGDGAADVLVAAPANYFPLEGQTFVVYGGNRTEPMFLEDLGSDGFVVQGAQGAGASGTAVAGGEDVDGDGVPDLVTGAPHASYRGRRDAGKAYVVFLSSRRRDVELRDLRRGAVVGGPAGAPRECPRDFSYCPGSWAGHSVAFLGDIDGDGASEIGVGAPWAGRPSQRGRAYVVWSGAVLAR